MDKSHPGPYRKWQTRTPISGSTDHVPAFFHPVIPGISKKISLSPHSISNKYLRCHGPLSLVLNSLGRLSSLTMTKINQVHLWDIPCDELCKTENHTTKNPCAKTHSTIPSGMSCYLWLQSNDYPALQQSIKPLAPWTCDFLTSFSVCKISKPCIDHLLNFVKSSLKRAIKKFSN